MAVLIKIMADYLLIPLVLIAAFALLFKVPTKGRYDKYLRIVMAGLSSYWLAKVIGNLWHPEALRPFEQLNVQPGAAYLGNAGFPSDHVLFATFLTLAVWYAVRRRAYTATMVALTVCVALGRVLALVHTPLDIAGGILIALVGGLWYYDYAKKSLHKKLAKTTNK